MPLTSKRELAERILGPRARLPAAQAAVVRGRLAVSDEAKAEIVADLRERALYYGSL